MPAFRNNSPVYVSSEVTADKCNYTVEVFAVDGFYGVQTDCGVSETTRVTWNTIEEFKKFVDEVNWVYEEAQKKFGQSLII